MMTAPFPSLRRPPPRWIPSIHLLKLMFGHESLTNAPRFGVCGSPAVLLFTLVNFLWRMEATRVKAESYVKAARNTGNPKQAGSSSQFRPVRVVSLYLVYLYVYNSARATREGAKDPDPVAGCVSLLGIP